MPATSTTTTTGGIELTEAESAAIIWHADSQSITIGEEMLAARETSPSLAEFEYLIGCAQLTASVWRAAEAGRLTPTGEIRDWLEGLRDDLRRYVGYHSDALRPGAKISDVARAEREKDQVDDLERLAACESLLSRLSQAEEEN